MKWNSKYLIGANLSLYHSNSAVCHDQSNDGFEVDYYFEQFPDFGDHDHIFKVAAAL